MPGSAHANWFFGLPLDGAFLEKLPPPPRGFRLFARHDVHLTVAFLGPCGRERADRALDALDASLTTTRSRTIVYALGEIVPLGHARRYSALSATLSVGDEEVSALITALRDPLVAAAEGRADTRPPLPHATIARPRRSAGHEERKAGLAWARSLDLRSITGSLDRIALYTRAEDRETRLFQIVAERPLPAIGTCDERA